VRNSGSIVQIRQIDGPSNGMSVCGSASCEVEALVGLNDSIDRIKRRLMKLTNAEVQLTPRLTPYLTSYHFSTVPFNEVIAQVIYDVIGKKMIYNTRQSVEMTM